MQRGHREGEKKAAAMKIYMELAAGLSLAKKAAVYIDVLCVIESCALDSGREYCIDCGVDKMSQSKYDTIKISQFICILFIHYDCEI